MPKVDARELHLPDCPIFAVVQNNCDCGTPPHPLPVNLALVKRKRKGDKAPRLIVIPKTKLKSGEKNYS